MGERRTAPSAHRQTSLGPWRQVPLEHDAVFTDAAAVIRRAFKRRGRRATIALEGVVTGELALGV